MRLFVTCGLLFAVLNAGGCVGIVDNSAGHGGGGSLQPISVSLSNAPTAITAGGSPMTVKAVVANDTSQRGVQWFLQVPISNGNQFSCAPTCGTLSQSGPFSVTYTPPPTVPGSLLLPGGAQPTDFSAPTLVAIATADNGKSASSNIKISGTAGQVLGVQIANPFAVATTGGNAIVLNVALTNDVNVLGVTWQLTRDSPQGPVDCNGPLINVNDPFGCGAILNATPFSVVYVPPLGIPLGSSDHPKITAIPVSDITKSASNVFTFQAATTPNVFAGHYAFQASGFDFAGKPAAIAGSFTADGFGSVTNVSLDVNDQQVIGRANGSSGAYYVDNQRRGNFQLNLSIGTANLTNPTFAFSLSADAGHGPLIGFDSKNGLTSGTIMRQDTSAFSLAGINNDYVFKLESNLPDRYDAVGKMSINLDSRIHVFMDTSRVNTGPSLVNAEFVASLDSPPDTTGRGTMTFGNANFAYYVVSSQLLYLLQIDPGLTTNSVWSGVVKFQSIQGFTPSTVNARSVFHVTGLEGSAAKRSPLSAIGTINITNQSQAALLWDSNNNGTVLAEMAADGQAVTFDPPDRRTGRGTITVTNGRTNGLADSFVFYLAESGDGFLLDTTPDVANRALVGDLIPQTGSGTFSASTLTDNLLLGSAGSSALNIGSADGLIAASNGNLAGTTDFITSSSTKAVKPLLTPYSPYAGTYQVIDAISGRGSAIVPGALFGQLDPVTAILYLVGSNRFVLMGMQMPSGISLGDSE